MIRFPRKRSLSISTIRAIRTRNQGAKKFIVENILKSAASTRRNLGSMDGIYQTVHHGYLPEVEKKN
jgi:hypothetical protein